MEKKMETFSSIIGLYRDQKGLKWLYRANGKENGNYYRVQGLGLERKRKRKLLECWGWYRDD